MLIVSHITNFKRFLQVRCISVCNCSTLQSLYKDTLAQRDSLSNELSKVKRSATPRPDWDRCASYIEGGSERWMALSQGRSSDGKVDILLAQIAEVDVSEIRRDDVFQGQDHDTVELLCCSPFLACYHIA